MAATQNMSTDLKMIGFTDFIFPLGGTEDDALFESEDSELGEPSNKRNLKSFGVWAYV